MRPNKVVYTVVIACLAMISQAEAKDPALAVHVFNAQGKSVEADVAFLWSSSKQSPDTLEPMELLQSEGPGRYIASELPRFPPPLVLTAMSKDRKWGAIHVLKSGELEVELHLQPLVPVHLPEIKLDAPLPNPSITMMVRLQKKQAGQVLSPHVVLSPVLPPHVLSVAYGVETVLLPPGDYTIFFHGSLMRPARQTFSVSPDVNEVVLPPLTMEVTSLGKHLGSEPPEWDVVNTKGCPKDVQVSDYKGKWLLIEFWAVW